LPCYTGIRQAIFGVHAVWCSVIAERVGLVGWMGSDARDNSGVRAW
jgi:hypothetical protein